MESQSQFVYAPAGIGVRFVAIIIDGAMIGLLSSIVYLPLYLATFFFDPEQGNLLQMAVSLLNYPLSWSIAALYVGFFYSRRGATPGKTVMKLKVLHSESGAFPSFWQSVGRELIGKTLNLFSCCLGYLMPLFRADKRALHDLAFSTRVVQRVK